MTSQPGTGGHSQSVSSRLHTAVPALGCLPARQRGWLREAAKAFRREETPAGAGKEGRP